MNIKSDKDRKGGILAFRVTQGERRRLELIRKETGQSFSGIFRERVLSLEEFPQYNPPAWQRRFHRKFQAIARRGDIGDSEKLRLLSVMLGQLERRGLKMQERQAVTKRYKGRRAG